MFFKFNMFINPFNSLLNLTCLPFQSVYLCPHALQFFMLSEVLAEKATHARKQFSIAPPIIYKEGDETGQDDQHDGCKG